MTSIRARALLALPLVLALPAAFATNGYFEGWPGFLKNVHYIGVTL
ncbi:hypothetical protein [Algiphilus aromaticivorans]|nr:hypothetical protein [Algiphilus aromaticivorans]